MENGGGTDQVVTGGTLAPGTMLDRYKLVRCLGVGGTGEVYYAVHDVLGTPCAIKILRPSVAREKPEFAVRLIREARMACRIQHKNIVGVFDASATSNLGCPYIVMEYVEGCSVLERLQNGPLPEDEVISIASGVAEALVAAAKYKIVHRDIKPANIMIDTRGQVKLADLGVAKSDAAASGGTLTLENTLLGTPNYAAPEQLRSSHAVDARADIYSLGATMYHMLTGRKPFSGDTVYNVIAKVICENPPAFSELGVKVSPALESLVAKMMDKDPEQRPQSAVALLELLRQAARGKRGRAFRPSPKFLRAAGVAASVVLVLFLAFLTGVFWSGENLGPGVRTGEDPARDEGPRLLGDEPAADSEEAPPAPLPSAVSSGKAEKDPVPSPAVSGNSVQDVSSRQSGENLSLLEELLNAARGRLAELEGLPGKKGAAAALLQEKIAFRRRQTDFLQKQLELRRKKAAAGERSFPETAALRREIEDFLKRPKEGVLPPPNRVLIQKIIDKLKTGKADADMELRGPAEPEEPQTLFHLVLAGRLRPGGELLRTLIASGSAPISPPAAERGGRRFRYMAGAFLKEFVSHASCDAGLLGQMLFLGYGVSFRDRNTGETPLHAAAYAGNAGAVRLLLAAESVVDQPDFRGETALFSAARAVNPDIYDLLLATGADPARRDSRERTAEEYRPDGRLRAAVAGGRYREVLRALRKGADPNLVLPDRSTILSAACRKGDPDVVRALIDRDAELNTAKRGQLKPLQCVYGDSPEQPPRNALEIFKLLVDRGADTNIPPPRGGTLAMGDHTLKAVVFANTPEVRARALPWLKFMLASERFAFSDDLLEKVCREGEEGIVGFVVTALAGRDTPFPAGLLLRLLRRGAGPELTARLIRKGLAPVEEEALAAALAVNGRADVIALFKKHLSSSCYEELMKNPGTGKGRPL